MQDYMNKNFAKCTKKIETIQMLFKVSLDRSTAWTYRECAPDTVNKLNLF